jgi:hypothetical protein
VPSPALAAKIGWYTLWFVCDPLVDPLALCTCGQLRLGVKRILSGVEPVLNTSVENVSLVCLRLLVELLVAGAR